MKNASEISERDWARRSLFSWLDEDQVFEKPTYKGITDNDALACVVETDDVSKDVYFCCSLGEYNWPWTA